MKKILALVLVVFMLFAAAGCAGKGDNSTGNNGEFSGSTIKLPDYKPTSNEVTMLTGMDNSLLDDPNQWYYSFNEKLKQEYGISIKHVTVPSTELPIKASQRMLSGQVTDLIEYREEDNPAFIKNGIVQPVEDLFDFNEPVYKHLEEFNKQFVYKDGHLYTFVRSYKNNGLCYYWLEDLAELGLETPRELYYKGEWTWSKFEEYANLLTVRASDGTVSRYGGVINSQLMHTTTGETFVRYENNKYINNLRNTKLAEYFNMIRRMTFETKVLASNVSVIDSLKAHTVSIGMSMRNYLDNHLLEELSNDWVSFAPIPKWEGADKYYVPALFGTTWIAKGAKNIDGARAWFAVYILLISDVDPEIEAAVNQLAIDTKGFDVEDFDMLYELKDTSKFEPIWIRDQGLGTNWSSGQRLQMINSVIRQNKSWASVVEEYYPILSAGIKEFE